MTKSTKHKKDRKQNLSKIKLKLGKTLKKAQNETKTDFKARKIILKEQLSVKLPSSLITKKNLNISELLTRLSHSSVYVRQDGLNGLKEIVLKNTKYELGPHLSNLFKGLNPCLLDTDHLIRTTAVKIIEAIILKIGNMIQPYFQLLASHLACAMVHLNCNVQSDSLLLMDVFLSHATSLIAQNANTVLKNYFMLISRKIDSYSKGNNGLSNYALISNPSSKLASIRWRIKLFKSLSKYLEAILLEYGKLEATIPVSSWQIITMGSIPAYVKKEGARAAVHGTKILAKESEAQIFIENLVPLMFNTLAEVNQNHSEQERNIETPLDSLSIEMLRYISEIVIQLWKIVEVVTQKKAFECSWFMVIFHKHLESDVLEGFPYVPLETLDKLSNSKSKAKTDIHVECHNLNITLSALAFLYMSDTSVFKERVADYYIDLLSNRLTTPVHKLDTMVSTANLLFDEGLGVSPDKCDKLMCAALQCYQRLSCKSRYILLKLPLYMTEHSRRHLWTSDSLSKWISAVVKDAIDNPNEGQIYELMLQFKLRNIPGFEAVMSENREMLREKLAAVKGSNSSNKISHLTIIV